MQIHQTIKEVIKNHKNKIELIQWAITSGVSSLVYSEYLMNIKRKTLPSNILLVPSIRSVNELLDPENQFMQLLSDKLIDRIVENETFKKYSDAPELVLFNNENIEIMKTIFDLYIINNISRRLPETISKKFGLDKTDDQLRFAVQSNELDLFNRQPITSRQLDFIVEETVLHLLTLIPTMKKSIELPESNFNIHMTDNEIITIGNDKAICPILLNKEILNNEEVIKMILFVTNTTVIDASLKSLFKTIGESKEQVTVIVNTGIFNQVSLTSLEGIHVEENK